MSASVAVCKRYSNGSPFPSPILAYLPWLWQRVLFPGKCPKRESPRLWTLALLIIAPAAFLYPCLSFWLFEPDEGRYAEIPREMLARGDWIVPVLQGEPYLDKPPLFYWLVMASYQVFGVHDWSARLIPALAIHASIILTYIMGCRLLGERAGLWGALALSLAPGFVTMGRLLVLDGVLTFWVLLSLFAAHQAIEADRARASWWILSAAACGLGVLTKGPVALVLLAIPLALHQWLARPLHRICRIDAARFLVIMLLVTAPWYFMMTWRLPEFAMYFFWKHNIVRFLAPFDHQQPIWFYVPILLAGLLPAAMMVPKFLGFLLRTDSEAAQMRSRSLGFVLMTGLWPILFFTLSGSKLPTYILPAFPPLALVLGYFLAQKIWRNNWSVRIVGSASVMVLAIAHFGAVPFYAWFHSPMSEEAIVRDYCADPTVPVVCYPRGCDSVSFYLGRDDFKSYRSKETSEMLAFLQRHDRTVVLFTHRHSPDFLRTVLPPQLSLGDLTPVSRSWARTWKAEYCYMGIVRQRPSPDASTRAISRESGGTPWY